MSKKPCFSEPSTDNMGNGLKHCCNLNDSIFTTLLITVKIIVLEKVSFSDMKNRETVS